MRFTQKQKQIMSVVVQGYYDEAVRAVLWYDIDQVRERLPYEVAKRPLQVSLDILEERGLLNTEYAVRRKKRRRVLVPTQFGLSIFRPQMTQSEPSEEDDDLVPGQSAASLFTSDDLILMDDLV